MSAKDKMTDKSGEDLIKELLTLPATPEMIKLAKEIVEANRQFDEELDRCLEVNPEVLMRRMTV